MAHSKFQPDHMGRRTPDTTLAPALSVSHGLGAGNPYKHDTPNIARDAGRGKDIHAILAHGSSTAAQIAGAGRGGMGHATVYDGGQPGLPHAYGKGVPKVRNAADRITPTMRSRQGGIARSLDDNTLYDLGDAIKREPVGR
jgi:hypothetical protein